MKEVACKSTHPQSKDITQQLLLISGMHCSLYDLLSERCALCGRVRWGKSEIINISIKSRLGENKCTTLKGLVV